jgi:xyloglucan-specific exo-beta-1,4-glucanase
MHGPERDGYAGLEMQPQRERSVWTSSRGLRGNTQRGARAGSLSGHLAVATCWAALSCGGSDGGSAPSPAPANLGGASGEIGAAGAAGATPSGVGNGGTPSEGPPPIAGLSGAAGAAASGGTGGGPPPPSASCDAASANASGYCWRSVVIGGGGFVSGLIVSAQEPDLIYARTDVGGAYRWVEQTQSWLPLNDWVSEDEVGLLGIESLALDPSQPSRLYMLAGINYFNAGKTAILSSDDYGQSFSVTDVTSQFKAHGNGMGRQSGERLAVDPNNGSILFTGTRQDGLFRSPDRGATWSRVAALDVTTTANGNGIAFVIFDPSAGVLDGATRHLYVGVSRAGESNLFESNDAGATFTAVPGQPTTYAPQRATLAAEGTLYVSYANGAGPFPSDVDPMDRGELWKIAVSDDAFTEITPLRGDQNRAFSGISVDASDPTRLLATTINTYQQQPWGYGDRMFLSTDGGTSWTDLIGAGRVTMATNGMPWIEQNAIHWAGSIALDPFNPERAFVTSGNGVFMTRDLSAVNSTWAFSVKGLEEMVPLGAASVPAAPLVSVMGDYDGFIHDDPNVSPARGRYAPPIGTTDGLAMAALAPTHLARVGSELYVSTDAAASWNLVTRPSDAVGGQLAFSADGSRLLWSVDTTTFVSPDQGASWAPTTGLSVAVIPEADAVNSAKFYAYDPDAGAMFVSGDGGSSFSAAATLPTDGARRVRAVPGVEGELWVALNGAGLTRSVDSGSSFQAIAAVQSCRAFGFGAPKTAGAFPAVYIWGAAGGGPRGLYRSDDAGASFVRINDDAHEYGGPGNGEFVIGDANVYGRVYMSSAGRGLILGELAPPAR